MSVIRRYPRVAAVTAVMLLVAAAALAAQTMKLDDGTYATKVVTYTKAGVEASSASNAAASE